MFLEEMCRLNQESQMEIRTCGIVNLWEEDSSHSENMRMEWGPEQSQITQNLIYMNIAELREQPPRVSTNEKKWLNSRKF